MTNVPVIFRSLIIYAVCVVLAVWLGVLLAGPLTYSVLTIYGLLAFTLIFPILLRWHYPLMVLSWNMAVIVFFLPGQPSLCLVMIMLSLGVSVFQRMLSRESQFVIVPQIILPLCCLIAVIVFTAKMTGVGLRSLGGEVYGGKKYVYLIIGIVGYFALSARRIPLKQKNLYLGLFFFGGITEVIGDLLPLMPHSLYFIYLVFSYNPYAIRAEGFNTDAVRLGGAVAVATLMISYMLARYGIRGIFLSAKPWRLLTFFGFFIYGQFGGFRGFIVAMALVFIVQFFLEGLHRTKLLAIFLSAVILVGLALIPLAPHLPYTFQRALTILPYKVNAAARLDAQASLDWRIQMWDGLLPQIPQYLLLGKGYVISQLDYNFVMGPDASIHSTFAQNQGLALAEDFHNGPISVIIPFGIWGCLAFLWFLAAGIRVLYFNYRYSDPELKTVNTFLLAAFVAETIFFMFIFGDLSGDMLKFGGWLGLSVSLNGGVRRRARVTQPIPETEKTGAFTRLPPAPAPAFQRRRPGIVQ